LKFPCLEYKKKRGGGQDRIAVDTIVPVPQQQLSFALNYSKRNRATLLEVVFDGLSKVQRLRGRLHYINIYAQYDLSR
jgi:hypothetical protein